MNKEKWKIVLQTIVTILTAVLTTFGTTSCISAWG